jgi:hypothetical protein
MTGARGPERPSRWTPVAAARLGRSLVVCLGLGAVIAACQATPARTRTIAVPEIGGSGVTGTVTLTELGPDRTRVELRLATGGHPDMPAHIHPGACPEPIPQPLHPLASVVDGASVTEVPASFDELLGEDRVVNVHKSNEEMRIFVACADLR